MELIPKSELIGLTVILLSCSFKEQEFVKIGYYVNIDYEDEELRENPPSTILYSKLKRTISDKPKVTRFPIKWDSNDENEKQGNIKEELKDK